MEAEVWPNKLNKINKSSLWVTGCDKSHVWRVFKRYS